MHLKWYIIIDNCEQILIVGTVDLCILFERLLLDERVQRQVFKPFFFLHFILFAFTHKLTHKERNIFQVQLFSMNHRGESIHAAEWSQLVTSNVRKKIEKTDIMYVCLC